MARRVRIVARIGMEEEVTVAKETVEGIYGLPVEVETVEDDEAIGFIDSTRGQVNALTYIGHLRNRLDRESFTLTITDLDIYVPGLNYCFGVALEPVALVSTYRLARCTSRELYLSRLSKEVSHELGHLLGLDHCSDPRCVMFFSNSIGDTDFKGNRPCRRCERKLKGS